MPASGVSNLYSALPESNHASRPARDRRVPVRTLHRDTRTRSDRTLTREESSAEAAEVAGRHRGASRLALRRTQGTQHARSLRAEVRKTAAAHHLDSRRRM